MRKEINDNRDQWSKLYV